MSLIPEAAWYNFSNEQRRAFEKKYREKQHKRYCATISTIEKYYPDVYERIKSDPDWVDPRTQK